MFSHLNGKLGSTNESSLSTSVLDKAIELATPGLFTYILGGAGYNGEDLINSNYAYGSAIILKRSKTSINVILTGIKSAPLAINYYNGSEWGGWQTYVRTGDLGYVDCSVDTVKDGTAYILNAPNNANYFTKITSHSMSNMAIEFVYWDGSRWRIQSNYAQTTTVRFYKYPT